MFGITDIYVRWSKAYLYLCSIFVVLLMLLFSSKAFAATTEIRAIIEPVRYIYLDNNDRVTKIQTNTNLNNYAMTFWIDYNNRSIKPSIKEKINYNIFVKKLPKDIVGTFYKSTNNKSIRLNLFSKISIITRIKILDSNS